MRSLDADECWRLLGTVSLGRVAITSGALPVILPVTFAVDDSAVLWPAVEGSRLAAATDGAVVAFHADAYSPDGTCGWSVVAVGTGRRTSESEHVEKVRTISAGPWRPTGSDFLTVRLDVATIHGRAL